MEDDYTGVDPTATEAAADAEEEEISDRGHHSIPSISDHSQMLPCQTALESVHLLPPQSEEDNEISSRPRQPLQGSFQVDAGTTANRGVESPSAMSQLSQNQLQEAGRSLQVLTGSSCIYLCR